MQKLRQKIINDFINTLNEREQKYTYEKLKEKYLLENANTINFTINNKTRVVA